MSIKLTFPPRKILVPLDFTEASSTAWKHAKALGASVAASVDGLFVQPWVHAAIDGTFGFPAPPVDPQAGLDALRRKLGAGDEIGTVQGDIDDTILSWGRNLGYDLIVMGTHGRSGLGRLFGGSVAEAIVRRSEIPVLVTRRREARYREILAPVHFEPYAVEGLSAAAQVAAGLGARLTALHVVSTPMYGGPQALKGSKHLLADALNRIPAALKASCRPKGKLAFGDPAEQIALAAADADLTVVVAHRRGFVRDIVLGTTTDRLLREGAGSLLALPYPLSGKKTATRTRAKAKAG